MPVLQSESMTTRFSIFERLINRFKLRYKPLTFKQKYGLFYCFDDRHKVVFLVCLSIAEYRLWALVFERLQRRLPLLPAY